MSSLYSFTLSSIDGKEVPLSSFAGKKVLIVNTASECSLTPQYEQLEYLHKHYGDKVQVLGFPANDFGAQEPGTNEEIRGFCTKNYGVTFPMFTKISVKGDGAHPLYKWLKEKTGKEPNWNFAKYLVDETGENVQFISAEKSPVDEDLLKKI
jgi:glutathione peroxidase